MTTYVTSGEAWKTKRRFMERFRGNLQGMHWVGDLFSRTMKKSGILVLPEYTRTTIEHEPMDGLCERLLDTANGR